ncbi:hypothetical protein FHL15_001580 [Xylaria flabelliformis]|uniref:Major facilitator superfamily (MFS) profile domain-containing protein n=1 Tax=Xylaria flabelliformis TaxID=2512241 RepID=A0A553IAS6_9PEZI|nr:hypothetical protein FHL15_001580 [Xylaria flabelliformis]
MRNHMAAGWFYSPEQIVRYFATRLTSLRPPKTELRNPIHVLNDLDRHQWLMFSIGFLGWTWDAFDFFTVSLCVTEIATEFKTTNSAVSWGITITLMLRSVGALIFGSLSDRYGRKWTMITNLFLFIIFELASGFAQSLPQFLGVRALYGIAMGGLYGPAAATALEDLPYDARGILSGVYQQGYAVGYLLAAIFYRAVELGPTEVTVISVVGQIGALVGGTTIGYVSTFFGRRLSMITCCIIGAAVLPAYTIPRSLALIASAFFLQFFVGGAWGPVPIHLSELSPPALRTTAVGLTYQLGNLASSAAATIQATIGERFPLSPKDGVKRYDYGKVIGIFMAAVWVYMLIFLFFGPEMTQEERAEYGAAADQIEKMRKDGVSLAEIGAGRAKLAALGDELPRPNCSEKPTDIEHIE